MSEKRKKKEKEIKITPIENGTVIDHINRGQAMKVLKIIGIMDTEIDSIVSIAMNVNSSTGRKDIVKVENMELKSEDLDRISLISPQATVNIIRDYGVIEKHRVKIPEIVKGIVRCVNSTCITNQNEPIEPEFEVTGEDPVSLKCIYCGKEMRGEEISEHVI